MIHYLEADGIHLDFGNRKILSDIYLSCETGKIIGLLGKNGQGKTSLLQAIYGSLDCEKSVRIDKVSLPEAYKRTDLIQYLPQFNFIPGSLSLKRVFEDFTVDFGIFSSLFPEFKTKYKIVIRNLSGGEQRLIALYIILKAKSHFALLDEPFTHISPLQIEKIKELMLEEKKHKGLIITDHMYQQVLDVCDNLYVLTNGQTCFVKELADIERLGYARI